MNWSLHVPEPWTKLPMRRGDALGFRNIAIEIADTWTPGISVRQRDARWLTLLCKGLSVLPSNLANDNERYDLLSKFERGILIAANNDGNKGQGRHLPRKTIAEKKWPKSYRYYGPWGVYKSLLITCGLVEEDNPWCLTEQGKKLADLINLNLTLDHRIKKPFIKLDQGWQKWWPLIATSETLTLSEQRILQPLLFGDDEQGITRRKTVGNLSLGSMEKFCKSQDLENNALNFDKFTRKCFQILTSVLESTDPGCVVNYPLEIEITKNPCTKWSILNDLSQNIENLPNKSFLNKLLRWHINHSRRPLFSEQANGSFIRVAGEAANVRKSYSYRLLNAWYLANQIAPDIFSDYPCWLENNMDDDEDDE